MSKIKPRISGVFCLWDDGFLVSTKKGGYRGSIRRGRWIEKG